MLKLYHASNSVCSQKARVGFYEKGLPFESVVLDLAAGDQFKPAYMRLNPNAVVPTLVDDGKVVIESSIIIQYLDDLAPTPRLMPDGAYPAARVRHWLLRSLEIHASVNSLSFATAYRLGLMKLPREEREEIYRRIPDPAKADKRRDLVEKGVASSHVDDAIRSFARVFRDMDADLAAGGPWLMGAQYTLADVNLIAYIDRLDRLGLSGFWRTRHPDVGEWLERSRARPSYKEAIAAFIPAAAVPGMRAAGAEAWPIIESKLAA
jgi:glutathione S-transferase